MARRWAVQGLTVLGVTVLAAGLVATGGPGQGRAERRDQTRDNDLAQIQSLLDCKAQQAGHVVIDPTPTEACPMTPRLADPFTAAPYRVELVAPDSIRLCAGFELPVEMSLRDEAGCRVWRIELR
ncbi:hypothetical protein [Paracoccus sp. S3-43]|uniref:hypothetical protein n=1 Tax=Paracoccus sp. S3-43 TaxID=3030011 RepID=UPI0023B19F30|nr:hypothetical protein [Paracoccus sp. S3-43]WEF25406.1 hypothetical protein PXD02_05575 [Paracoccus sp. S3-43]